MAPDPTASGNPKTLNASGDDFRDAANALGRVQNAFYDGGESAVNALKENAFGDQHDVGKKLESLARKMYTLLWSANFELQNAAMNYWQVAEAFAKADRVLPPPGAKRVPDTTPGDNVHYRYVVYDNLGPGREHEERVVGVEDGDGNIIHLTVDGQHATNANDIDRPPPPDVPLPPPAHEAPVNPR